MLENRYFTVMLILLVLLTGGILIKADSQIQLVSPKFKVAVSVTCEENLSHRLQVDGAIKRELRSFGDVQIVGNDISDGLWEYFIDVNLLEIKDSYGNISLYAASYSFYKKIPIEHFAPHWQEFYRKYPAINIPRGYTGAVGIQKLEQQLKAVTADFDKEYLQHVRDFRTRSSR